jgi:hypothetical protein
MFECLSVVLVGGVASASRHAHSMSIACPQLHSISPATAHTLSTMSDCTWVSCRTHSSGWGDVVVSLDPKIFSPSMFHPIPVDNQLGVSHSSSMIAAPVWNLKTQFEVLRFSHAVVYQQKDTNLALIHAINDVEAFSGVIELSNMSVLVPCTYKRQIAHTKGHDAVMVLYPFSSGELKKSVRLHACHCLHVLDRHDVSHCLQQFAVVYIAFLKLPFQQLAACGVCLCHGPFPNTVTVGSLLTKKLRERKPIAHSLKKQGDVVRSCPPIMAPHATCIVH